jgi:D-sedoheptulose 7-phosphate isomerase/D-glycero-D-manno-heptose 1,7-bisphosphate phosphatase
MSRPGVLLDRDGTIIVDTGYVGDPADVVLIPGSAEAIRRLNRAQIPVAVLTNQSGVARGYFTEDDVALVHRHLSQELKKRDAHIDLYLYCPFHPEGVIESYQQVSKERKPEPGMAFKAAERLSLDLSLSWMVGDQVSDIEMAERSGARAVFIGKQACDIPGIPFYSDLAGAIGFVLNEMGLGGAA